MQYIAEGQELNDIVTMREKIDKILRNYFESAKTSDQESQKGAVIETAAKFIKTDIKTTIPSVTDQYPSSKSLKLDSALGYLAPSLWTKLNSLLVEIDKDEKVAAVSQAIT